MISPHLLALARCPDCRQRLTGDVTRLVCGGCGRAFADSTPDYLVLKPSNAYRETTKFVDEGFHADGRDESVAPPLLSAAVRNNMLRKFLQPGSGDLVLDLGCGSGRFAVWNLDSGAHFIGIDTGTFFAAESKAAVDLVVGELRQLPFDTGALTKAYAIDVVEHLSAEGLDAMLREIHRVLAPGGSLFIYTHVMQRSPFAPVLAGIAAVSRAIERIGLADLTVDRLRPTDHLNPLASRAHLEQVADRAGFRVARFRYYTPILSRIAESIVVPLGAHAFARRASKGAVDSSGLRSARLAAKERLRHRGLMYRTLRAMTTVVMLDVTALGGIRSGPFFALLVK